MGASICVCVCGSSTCVNVCGCACPLIALVRAHVIAAVVVERVEDFKD